MSLLFNMLSAAAAAKSLQSCPTLCSPMDHHPPGSSVHGILQARILEWVVVTFSRGSSQPRDRTQVSCIMANSLPAEPQGKPKNTGVGSLSFLQRIFQTQELNQGLLHCRQILYQLSYQRSPRIRQGFIFTYDSKVYLTRTAFVLWNFPVAQWIKSPPSMH